MNQPKIIQVADLPADMVGATVSWQLAKGGVEFEALMGELTDAGIAHYPEAVTPAAAVLRLLTTEFQSRRCLVKPVADPSGGKATTYGMLPRGEEGGHLTFKETWSVSVYEVEQSSGGQTWKVPTLRFNGDVPDGAEAKVRGSFLTALETMGPTEQSGWLVSLVKNHLKGITVLGGAGVYFIDPSAVLTWRKLRAIVAPMGMTLHEMPAMRSDQALDMILASLREFCDTEVAELEKDLQAWREANKEKDDKGQPKRARRSAVQARQERIGKVIEKVARFEELLDCRLTDVRDGLLNLKCGFSDLAVTGEM